MPHTPIRRRAFLRHLALAGAGIAFAPLYPFSSRLLAAAASAAPWPGLTPADVDSRIAGLMQKFSVPGVSIALIHDGEVAWRGAYGRLRADREMPVTEDSIFQAASISKPVFAIGVMKLVETGRLDLDTPLQSYLDEPWIEGEPEIEKVTARMVLEHSTGWPNWRRGNPLTFNFTPGTGFSYSGEGFIYLQTAVEQIVGVPLDDWLSDQVLTPLGMGASSYTWRPEMEETGSWGHDDDAVPSAPRKFSSPSTSHSLLTSAGDLARSLTFTINQPAGAPGLPQPATVQKMLERQQVDPRRTGTYRGLGWALQEGPELVYHTGSNGGGHRACAMASLESGAGIVVLTNGPGGRELYVELIQSVTGAQPAFR